MSANLATHYAVDWTTLLNELRRLRILHEDFIRYLSARLSLYLRMELGLKMARLTTATYAKFTESLPNPTHLCLFKAEPLAGVGILDINPRLALTIADRLLAMLGGAMAELVIGDPVTL